MYNALVIGCGNIGALYDFTNDKVLTHAKALYNSPYFSLTVFDNDEDLAKKIADRYEAGVCQLLSAETMADFDCISICSPTGTHVHYLQMAFKAGVKLVICEKPVSDTLDELLVAEAAYRNHSSNVLVNYMRRFQPLFRELKTFIQTLLQCEVPTNIGITYQRGFINNCSHAFDILEFLFDEPIELSEINFHNRAPDHFDHDRTLSLQAYWNKINVNIFGLSNVSFSNFEIDVYFEFHRISLKDSGNRIEVLKAEKNSRFLQPLHIQHMHTREGALKNFMEHTINHAHKILTGDEEEDNFLEAVSLNKRLLTYVKN